MVRFLQSTGLTGFSDLRGSVPAWTLNVLAHACCSDKDIFSVSHLANKSFSVACTQCQYPDEYCTCQQTGKQAASFDHLIAYFAKYKKANMIGYQNA